MKRSLAILLALFMLMPAVALAASVTLVWDPSVSGPEPTSYRIYMWNDSIEVHMVSEVPGTTLQATINDIEPGVYYFVARSYAVPWGESGNSNVVITSAPAGAPTNLRFGMIVAALGPIGLILGIVLLLARRRKE
jgi:hypothetical protein